MELKVIPFTSAVPKILWINEIILEFVNKLPAKLFDELNPWRSIITQYPFIHKFTIAKAMETISKVSSERTVLDEPLFPTDYPDSEDNLKQFIERKPVRLMMLGDTNSSFYEISNLLVKYFKTNNVTPVQLVNQEIAQKTNTGKWLENILNIGEEIPTWVVMKLLEIELEKEKYVTKGFILTGFPIVSSLNAVHRVHCISKNEEASNLESDFINQEFIFPDGNEDDVLKNCVQMQLAFVYNLCFRPDYIVYLDTHHYTKQFAKTIEIFQKFILFYFRENVIRIDCRIGPDAVFSSIINRFKYINLKINYECFVMNECQKNPMSLKELCETETALPNYKWWISKFGRICPVNLDQGRLRLCDNQFPIRYLRYIFLCFSQGHRKQFIQNPGKYTSLVPKCRVAVIGPHRTGKTTMSHYLASFFKADIYRNHIQKSHEIIKTFDPTDELEELNKDFLRKNLSFKHNKIEEWNTCVLEVLNDVMTKTLNEEKINPRFDWFTSKNSERYFENIQTSKLSDNYMKQVVLQHLIFQKSIELITAADFLSWIASIPKPELLYKQYVIDSAPLQLSFWRDLLSKDELPDCVFFLKVSSVKKLIDTYSSKHNIHCVNAKYMCDKLCCKFIDFKDIFKSKFENCCPTHTIEPVKIISKSLIEKRYRNALKFMEKYEEVQNFLQENNVKCIGVDISNQTWTQSIQNALIEYMSMYEPHATSVYDFVDNEDEESSGSGSCSSLNIDLKEDSIESNCSFTTYNNNYGSCLDWCPVSLHNQNILKKGSPLYNAEYKNRIYTMYSKADLTEFISNPMFYSRIKFAVPPPRIFILGVNNRSKTNFAENLASSLNVEIISYKQNPTTMPFSTYDNESFSVQQLRESYIEIRQQFLEDLAGDYKKGVVLLGFPILLEQFNDLIENNLYPECVLLFNDEEEIMQTFYRHFARCHMMQALTMSNTLMDRSQALSPNYRSSSITSYIESLPDSQKHGIEIKCFHLIKLLQQQILKIEEQCLKIGISILKVPKNKKQSKEICSFVEIINSHRHRVALFENVQEITMDESEVLLNSGYYRFSRFKYSCPVDVSRLMTLNQFEGLRIQRKVYPCIYLDFIYFLCGKKNLKDFKWNPLEFINTCNPPQLQDPIRIAVFGASKSGVSTICRSMAHEFGFKILSPKDLKDETDSAIIDLLKMEKSSTPNGVILDNFHLTPKLLQEAAISTVDISVVFVLVSSFEKILENWFMQNRNLKNSPSLSLPKIHRSFCETLKAINYLRMSNATSLLNIHYIDGNANSWTIWDKVKNETIKTTRCITSYKIKLIKNRCANLGYLNMFYDSLIFKREINHFYCQACLSLGKLKAFKYFYVNVGPEFYTEKCQKLLSQPYGYMNDDIYKIFKFSKPFEANEMITPLKTQSKNVMCMFQYKHIFYWACNDHTINFMLNTHQYFKDSEKLRPLYVPFLVIGYTKEFVAFQGFCPVEYEHGNSVKGAMNLSVYYRKKVYLLSSIENTHEFLTFPEKYRNIKFDLCLHNQKIGIFKALSEDMISNIVLEVSKSRPKHFALDGRLSATTFIALKLKCFNSSKKYNEYWHSLIRNFTNDCKKLPEEIKKYQENANQIKMKSRRVPVPDERFDFLCDYHKPLSKVPAFLNVVDIAGLVKGAAEGQGLGNAFLSHISACDAIFHLCRAFEDPDVTHVEGEVDPVRDLEIISEELRLKDEEKLLQNLDKLEKVVARGGDKKLKPEYDSMLKVKSILCDEKKHLRFADWNLHDIETLNKYMFLTTKPAIYLINLSDKDFIRKKNKWLAKIKEWVDKNDPGAIIIPFSGHFENTLAEKEESERKAYEEETKCKSVLDKIIVTGYKALQLEYFFTAGPDEVKAWTIQKGTKAPQAAGRIHTDFEKGFIMAEVMHFKDFKEEGSETAAKSAGKYRQQGRNYVVEDGDIIFFKFNAGAGLKDAKKK